MSFLPAVFCLLAFSMMSVSAAPGGSSLGGVYAMKRAGDDSDYAFEFDEYGGEDEKFGHGNGNFEERESAGVDYASYGDYSYAVPQYDDHGFDYYN